MSTYELIRFETDGALATITLDCPKKLNAMNEEMLTELFDATKRANEDDDVRIVILTGAGRSFCAGADLTMRHSPGGSVGSHLDDFHRPILMAIREAPKPWISAVRGAAAGIGSAYAMGCDLTVMAEDAYLYQAFSNIGLVPDGGATWHLTRTIGRKRAYELIATGEKLPATRCLELGLCNRVVPTDRLLERTRDWAGELARRAPLALRHAKTSVRTASECDFPTTFTREVELQALCSESADHLEGVRAFMEKREPVFEGR